MSDDCVPDAKRAARGRAWCFTINNYTEEECALIESLQTCADVRGLTCGKEVGKCGTPHLQGYLELSKEKTMKSVCKILGGRAHVLKARGTPEENEAYCSKVSNWTRFGTFLGQGDRSDLRIVREKLTSGCSLSALILNGELDSPVKLGFAEKILRYVEPKRNWVPQVIWIWGNSGGGKSRLAHELAGKSFYRKATGMGIWWDGYDGEDTVILDDLRPGDFPFMNFLNVCDRYSCQVQVKCGSRSFLAKRIIVTTINTCRETYHGQAAEPMEQALRRITYSVNITDIDRIRTMIRELPPVETVGLTDVDELPPWA